MRPRIPTARFRLLSAALVLLLGPGAALAAGVPGIDFRARVGSWDMEPSGVVSSDGDDFDVEDDLRFGAERSTASTAYLDHPVPVLPNLRVSRAAFSDAANATLSSTRQFGPVQFQTNERVRSSYDVEMTDATFYYSPLDNWVSLDLGLTARHLDIDVEIDSRDSNRRERAGGSVVLPMGYLAARLDVPLSGVYADGELNVISAGGDRLRDVRLAVGWEAESVFGVEIGYRELSLDVDDVDDLSADVDFQGPYAAATLRF